MDFRCFWCCWHTEFFLKALFHVVHIKKIISVFLIYFYLLNFLFFFLLFWNLFLAFNHFRWNYLFDISHFLIIFVFLNGIRWFFLFSLLLLMNNIITFSFISLIFHLFHIWWFYLSFFNFFLFNHFLMINFLLMNFRSFFFHVFQRKIYMNSINDRWSFSMILWLINCEIYLLIERNFLWLFDRINWWLHEINRSLRPDCSWAWSYNIG